jgi:single-strand DNA-binding protein
LATYPNIERRDNVSNINVVVISGNLGQDPELRFTPKGTQVATFSVASNRVWYDRETNQKNEETSWIRCEAWGKMAETINNYVKKGSHVVIHGRLKQDKWEDNQGQQRSIIKVIVRDIQLPPRGASAGAGAMAEAAANPLEADEPPVDEDVPF